MSESDAHKNDGPNDETKQKLETWNCRTWKNQLSSFYSFKRMPTRDYLLQLAVVW